MSPIHPSFAKFIYYPNILERTDTKAATQYKNWSFDDYVSKKILPQLQSKELEQKKVDEQNQNRQQLLIGTESNELFVKHVQPERKQQEKQQEDTSKQNQTTALNSAKTEKQNIIDPAKTFPKFETQNLIVATTAIMMASKARLDERRETQTEFVDLTKKKAMKAYNEMASMPVRRYTGI